jgi:Ran GTPase-activating protein (RanGAP) involved in mRNA processing and transport
LFSATLISLDLSRSHLEEHSAPVLLSLLRSLPALRILSLASCGLTHAHTAALAQAYQEGLLLSVEKLSVSRNQLSPEALATLLTGLVTTAASQSASLRASVGERSGPWLSLTELDLSDNRLDDGCCQQLTRVLATRRIPLTVLDLSGCSLPGGQRELWSAIGRHRTLQQLKLVNAGIDDAICADLAGALAGGALQQLNLAGNSIKEAGARVLAAACRDQHQLTHLDLQRNQLGESFWTQWLTVLADHPSLREVNLRDNVITAAEAERLPALPQAVAQAPELRQLSLLNNALPRPTLKQVADLLAPRQRWDRAAMSLFDRSAAVLFRHPDVIDAARLEPLIPRIFRIWDALLQEAEEQEAGEAIVRCT